MSIILVQWCVTFWKNQWNTSDWIKLGNIRVFSDTKFCVYILGLCPYIVKCGLDKTFIFAYHMQCPTESMVNFCTTFFSNALAKFCAWNAKLATLTSCSAFFFLLPQVTMYISSSVTMHLLGSITESTEFQSNSTGFKLFSSTDIRFEQIKRK